MNDLDNYFKSLFDMSKELKPFSKKIGLVTNDFFQGKKSVADYID